MMDDRERTRTSRFLSYVLRHHPASIGLRLDAQGWVEIDRLLARCPAKQRIDRRRLEEIVATSDKQRFAISLDGTRIRANQGHSIGVDLGLVATVPPQFLFHGTLARHLESIGRTGLKPGQRHHVHLSVDEATAVAVGGRRGEPLILRVDAAAMHRSGARFFVSENGVWLTDAVAPEFLRIHHSGNWRRLEQSDRPANQT